MIDIHPHRHSEFCTIRSNIFDINFDIINKMEYVAIPKSEFIKHYKIIEAKKGTIKAIKDEITITKRSKTKRPRKRPPTPSESEPTETESD